MGTNHAKIAPNTSSTREKSHKTEKLIFGYPDLSIFADSALTSGILDFGTTITPTSTSNHPKPWYFQASRGLSGSRKYTRFSQIPTIFSPWRHKPPEPAAGLPSNL